MRTPRAAFVVFVQSQNCGGGGTIETSAGGITAIIDEFESV